MALAGDQYLEREFSLKDDYSPHRKQIPAELEEIVALPERETIH